MKILILASLLLVACAKRDSVPADSSRAVDSVRADSGAGRDTLPDSLKVNR